MAKRRARRASAARTLTKPGKTFIVRRGREGTPKGSRRAAPLLLPLMSRLRRLEVLVLHMSGALDLEPVMLQKMLDNIKIMRDDTADLGDKSGNTEV